MGEGRGAPSFHLSVTGFPKHGIEMHVLMPGGPGLPAVQDYHGATLHRMGTAFDFMPECGRSKFVHHGRIFAAFLYWFLRAVPAGLRLAREIHPDVVFGMGSLGASAGWLVARASGVPNVTRLFGTELPQLMGSPLRLLLRYRDIAAYVAPASYYIMCNDGSGADRIAERYGVPARKILHWFNGVDKDVYTAGRSGKRLAERLGLPADATVVMTASRLHPQKHVERAIAAAPDVRAVRDDVYFLIVGEGEQGRALESLAADLGVSDRVIFTGALQRQEMAEAYALADIFVALSDRTNMGNPLYEAMMSELVVVVLNSGTTGEVVRDDENGVLLERTDLSSLGRVLLDLMDDPERMKRLGRRARIDADKFLPTIQERQAMEVGVVERAVSESRSKR